MLLPAAAADEAELPSGAASEGVPAGRGPSDGVRELLLEEEEQAPDDELEEPVVLEEGEGRLLRRDERRRRLRNMLI